MTLTERNRDATKTSSRESGKCGPGSVATDKAASAVWISKGRYTGTTARDRRHSQGSTKREPRVSSNSREAIASGHRNVAKRDGRDEGFSGGSIGGRGERGGSDGG